MNMMMSMMNNNNSGHAAGAGYNPDYFEYDDELPEGEIGDRRLKGRNSAFSKRSALTQVARRML